MKYNPAIHHRRSIRLRDYDYSQSGTYFITLCVQGRECLLGKINDKSLHLNQHGLIVEKIWQEIPNHFPCISLDAAIVMPNHFHGILTILDNSISERSNHLSKTKNIREKRPRLGQVVAYFKYQSTKIININRDMIGVKLWQRSYYEHIIRSEASLNRLRQYILSNPEKWQLDQLHPENPSKW